MSLDYAPGMLLEGLTEHVAQLFGSAACAFDDYDFVANRALAEAARPTWSLAIDSGFSGMVRAVTDFHRGYYLRGYSSSTPAVPTRVRHVILTTCRLGSTSGCPGEMLGKTLTHRRWVEQVDAGRSGVAVRAHHEFERDVATIIRWAGLAERL